MNMPYKLTQIQFSFLQSKDDKKTMRINSSIKILAIL